MAWTERFCRADAAGGGNGTTDTASGGSGAWTLAEAVAAEAAGMLIWVKAGTYANTTTTRTLAATGTTTAPIWWRGFNTTPGDLDASHALALPQITFTTVQMTVSGAHHILSSLDISGARTGGTQLNITGANTRIDRCRVENTGANALSQAVTASAGSSFTRSWFKATTTASRTFQPNASGISLQGNVIQGGIAGLEFVSANIYTRIDGCVFLGNLNYGLLISNTAGLWVSRCSVYNPGSDGIRWTGLPTTVPHVITDCIFSQCGGYGLNNAAGTTTACIHRSNNLFYSNTSGNEFGFGDTPSFEELTDSASPFVNAPTDMTIASGSIGVGSGMPGLFENQGYTSYRDRGAVQRQGGGGYVGWGGAASMMGL